MDSLWMMIRSQEERFCPMETGLTRWGRVWWSVEKSYERNINTTAPWSTSVWTTNWTLGLVKKNNHCNIKYMDSSCNSPNLLRLLLDMSQRYLNLISLDLFSDWFSWFSHRWGSGKIWLWIFCSVYNYQCAGVHVCGCSHRNCTHQMEEEMCCW